jgi:hypothetical protein
MYGNGYKIAGIRIFRVPLPMAMSGKAANVLHVWFEEAHGAMMHPMHARVFAMAMIPMLANAADLG